MASFTKEELKSILQGKILQEGEAQRFRDVCIDSRHIRKGCIFMAIRGVYCDGHDFIDEAVRQGAQAVVLSKRIHVKSEKVLVLHVPDTTLALGDLARYHRARFQLPVISITGSAGKTTTKELIAHVLKSKFRVLKNKGSWNNHWGVPLTLLQMSHRHDAAVIEIGTNHPGEIAYLSRIVCPTIAVFTNIGASHLEGLKSIEAVFREKRSMIDALALEGRVVFNADDPYLARLGKSGRNRCSYGVRHRADIRGIDLSRDKQGRVCFKIDGRFSVCLRTPVAENVWNALAAVSCARLLKIPYKDICSSLAKIRFGQNRQQICSVKGVKIINDSYNANPVSFRSALQTLVNFPSTGKRVLICGDMLELGKEAVKHHREIGKLIAQSNVDGVFAFGKHCRHLSECVRAKKPEAMICSRQDMKVLCRDIGRYVERGDIVLVKGSRGMRMERAIDFLKENLK